MLPSPSSAPSSSALSFAGTHSGRRCQGHSPSQDNQNPSVYRNPTQPNPRTWTPLDVTDSSTTVVPDPTPIPPTTFASLPLERKKLLRRNKKLLWAFTIGFQLSIIVLTVFIVLAVLQTRPSGGRVRWFTPILGVLGFWGALCCGVCLLEVWRNRRERRAVQESWVEVNEQRATWSEREMMRQLQMIEAIRAQAYELGTKKMTRQTSPHHRGRSRHRDSDIRRSDSTNPEDPPIVRDYYPHRPLRISPSQPPTSPSEWNDIYIAANRSSSLDRYVVGELQRRKVARDAAERILRSYAWRSPGFSPRVRDTLAGGGNARKGADGGGLEIGCTPKTVTDNVSGTSFARSTPPPTPTSDHTHSKKDLTTATRSTVLAPANHLAPTPHLPPIPNLSLCLSHARQPPATATATPSLAPPLNDPSTSSVVTLEAAYSESSSLREMKRVKSCERVERWWARRRDDSHGGSKGKGKGKGTGTGRKL